METATTQELAITRKRRKWSRGGKCQDCGRDWLNTTVVIFWVNSMKYRVCRDCIRMYRGSILKP